jgi:nicotinamidase-related amidase
MEKPNTALLVMDMQARYCRLPETPQLLRNVSKAIAHARENKIPVIYVTVGFRQGAPEINMNNKAFATGKDGWADANVEEWMKIETSVAPSPGDIILIKRLVSAFTGSDLEVVLRSQGIQHIILTGVATSGVVLSTVREAADKDYHITVLADGCADADEEVHQVLTTKVFLRQTDVVTVEEWSKT